MPVPFRPRPRSILPWLAIALALVAALSLPASSRAESGVVDVFPVPGGRVAAPTTQISFRGVPASQLGAIVVTGSESGGHAGRVLSDSDGMGGSFVPTQPFDPGEQVTVDTDLPIAGGNGGAFSFTIATPAGAIRGAAPARARRVAGDVDRFVSAPQLAPAAVKVTRQPGRATASGDLFLAPERGPEQSGPEILGPRGGLIWSKALPRNQTATDFRVQRYEDQPVLTWWQGTATGGGIGIGQGEIYNSAYEPIATVQAGNGLAADRHELQLTPQSAALITAYYPVYWDASGVKHGSTREIVLDAVVQEIDIPTGLVLYQWDSLDHVPVTASHQPAPTRPGQRYDYFHIDAVHLAPDGSLIVTGRNTWAAYDVSQQTGAIVWALGGRASSFKMGHSASFAFPHDAQMQPDGRITLLDNGAGPPAVHKQSRAIALSLDTVDHTASLVRQDLHRPALRAPAEGDVQAQPNGDALVGWGAQPFITEFNSRGQTVFDARFVGANSSYRAYRFKWHGSPDTEPSVGVRAAGKDKLTVYASWNGATQVAHWRVLGGSRPTALRPVASSRLTGFETAIALNHTPRYVATEALGGRGRSLGVSSPVATP